MRARLLTVLDPVDAELSVAATARLLSVHRSTVLRLALLGRLVARVSAGRPVFQRVDVVRLQGELQAARAGEVTGA